MLIREGISEHAESVFMMGFDAWNNGLSREKYLEACRNSKKYPQGTWYVLEEGGKPVSSLILYRAGFDLPDGCWGVGSVATPPGLRRRGYAAKLLNHVAELAIAANARAIYLFSGIDPGYYARFGYEAVPAAPADLPGVCMARCFTDREKLLQAVPAFF